MTKKFNAKSITLRTLLIETSPETFEVMLNAFVQQIQYSNETQEFADYFRKYYLERKHQWAFCYRKNAGINTNMYLEGFHRVLKYIYLKGKTNKRVDKCVHVLLKISRDKAFERLTKLENGKLSSRMAMITKRHKSSLDMSENIISSIGDDKWSILSSIDGHTYEVTREDECSRISCNLRCHKCQICIHNFICSCPDSLIRATICKHIHLLASKLKTALSSSLQHSSSSSAVNTTTMYASQQFLLKELQTAPINQMKLFIHKHLQHLTLFVDLCFDNELLKQIHKHILSAIHLASIEDQPTLPSSTKSPVTKNIERQQPFRSVRKRSHKPASVQLAKPCTKTTLDVKKSLLSISDSHKDEILKMILNNEASTDIFHTKRIIQCTDFKKEVADELINFEVTLRSMSSLFSEEAWCELLKTVLLKKQQWLCHTCHQSTTTTNMVCCDRCNRWYHWLDKLTCH
jgi:hypothetical protein